MGYIQSSLTSGSTSTIGPQPSIPSKQNNTGPLATSAASLSAKLLESATDVTDRLSALPNDVLCQLISYPSPEEQLKVTETNKALHKLREEIVQKNTITLTLTSSKLENLPEIKDNREHKESYYPNCKMLGFTDPPTDIQLDKLAKLTPNICSIRFTNIIDLNDGTIKKLNQFKELNSISFNNTKLTNDIINNLPKFIKKLEIPTQNWTEAIINDLLYWLNRSHVEELTLGEIGGNENEFNFKELPFNLPKQFKKLIILEPKYNFYGHKEERNLEVELKTTVFSKRLPLDNINDIPTNNPFSKTKLECHFFQFDQASSYNSRENLEFINKAANGEGNQNQIVCFGGGDDNFRLSPLAYALLMWGEEIFSSVNLDTIEKLLEQGADPNLSIETPNSTNNTIFNIAIENQKINTDNLHEITNLLLRQGLILEPNNNQNTPHLIQVLEHRPNDHKLLQLLTKHQASILNSHAKEITGTLFSRKGLKQNEFHAALIILHKAGFSTPASKKNAEENSDGYLWSEDKNRAFKTNYGFYESWLASRGQPQT